MKVIIWIIGLLIYFYAQSRKAKKTEAPGEEPKGQPQGSGRPISFEDLLREIQQSRKPEPARPASPEVVDYDEDIREEAEPVEVVPARKRQEEVTAVYEAAKQAAFQRASLEDTVSLQEIPIAQGKFKGYEQESRPALATMIADDFKSPENLRKAFIMSEILNRRF